MQHGGDTIREDTPARHRLKAGTPTMGGLIILVALLGSTLLWATSATATCGWPCSSPPASA